MIAPSDLDGELFGGQQKLNSHSFDSGYSASPTGRAVGTSIARRANKQEQVLNSINMDTSNFFITSPNKYSLNANMVSVSPLKTEPVGFSPFKDSSLSPFKLINQSPSKGSFDDWDKNFIEGFEENLFGIMNDLPTMEDLLKSPKGKALIEKGRSSVDLSISPAKYITIAPLQRPQEMEQRETTDVRVKQEPAGSYITKQENIENDHIYGQTYVYVNTSGALSAIDPDKMSATPIKPRHIHVENAPKRKLAMKTSTCVNPVQTITFTSNQHSQSFNSRQPVWPSRERLNFARSQFKQALNKAVEREKQILKEHENANVQKSIPQQSVREKKTKVKATGEKSKKSAGGKSKGKARKGSKKDRYPEISMALSKPTTGKRNKNSHRSDSFELAPDYDDYLDGTDDEYDDDDVDVTAWDSRPPFYRQMSTGFNTYSDDTSDEEWTTSAYKYQRLDGRVTMKKRRR